MIFRFLTHEFLWGVLYDYFMLLYAYNIHQNASMNTMFSLSEAPMLITKVRSGAAGDQT
jgi:hypothetical protein